MVRDANADPDDRGLREGRLQAETAGAFETGGAAAGGPAKFGLPSLGHLSVFKINGLRAACRRLSHTPPPFVRVHPTALYLVIPREPKHGCAETV